MVNQLKKIIRYISSEINSLRLKSCRFVIGSANNGVRDVVRERRRQYGYHVLGQYELMRCSIEKRADEYVTTTDRMPD